MIRRDIEEVILKAAETMPVICITGPRQSGKTTLVKHLFPQYSYYNLEFPEHRQFAQSDANAFLRNATSGIIIDEIQRLPELLSYIQFFVDENKLNGKIILTGSQNILLMQSVSQSLAGRTALFTLLPFSVFELEGTNFYLPEAEDYLVKSLYPRIYDQNPDPVTWLQDYISTYVERDVRQITAIRDLSQFSAFLQICAGHTGKIINYTTISNSLGVDVKTIRAWLSILETSYIVFMQPPWFRNVNKRVIKSPRLFFYDTGLACNLLGVHNKNSYFSHYLRGSLFESFIISELHKFIFNHKINGKVYFFRDSNGNEVDALLELPEGLKAIEIKAGKTIIPDFFKGLQYWDKITGLISSENYLVYGGNEYQKRSAVTVLGWKHLQTIFGKRNEGLQ